MPDPQRRVPHPRSDLSSSDLNPRVNPDPEARLRSGDRQEVAKAPPPSALAPCAKCGYQNANVHRFCGMCGTPLPFDPAFWDQHLPFGFPRNASVRGDVAAPRPAARSEPVFPTLSLYANLNDPPEAEAADDQGVSDIGWLRQKNLSAGEPSAPRRWAWFLLAVFGVLLMGVFFYPRLRPHQRPSIPGEPSMPLSQRNSLPLNQPGTDGLSASVAPTPKHNPVTANPATGKPSAAHDLRNSVRKPIAEQGGSAFFSATPTEAEGATVTEASTANGSVELATAEAYLSGKNGSRNSAEAAKLLWRAVAKGNTTAILLLSDLYKAGDGVAKSCDQARLLLRAAVQKNVAEATPRLRELETSGCP